MAQADTTLQAILAHVTKIDDQQDKLIGALGDMTDTLGIVLATLSEIVAWTQQPASGGLEEAMNEIAGALGRIDGNMAAFAEQVATLNRRPG